MNHLDDGFETVEEYIASLFKIINKLEREQATQMNRSLKINHEHINSKISHVDTSYIASLEHLNSYLLMNDPATTECPVCHVAILPSMTVRNGAHVYCSLVLDKMDANEKRLVNMQHPNNMPPSMRGG